MDDRVTVLGARGSIPVAGADFARYGGATTCVLVRLAGETVLLDAGTGLLDLPPSVLAEPRLPLLLTHPHADHLLGLPLCAYVMKPGCVLELYAAPRNGLDARAQVERLLSPPLWPVTPDILPAQMYFFDLPETLRLGAVTVDAIEGAHPGGVSLLRLTGGGKRVVFLTDFTMTERSKADLTDFARNCDLLLCDGQYSDEEWATRAEFGHTTWRMAAELGQLCGAKRVRVIHHDPRHTDAMLDAAEAEVRAVCPRCALARQGEVIAL